MDSQSDGLSWLGRYSGVAVTLSIVACYGTLALIAGLSLGGLSISVNEGVWATVIVVLAWVAVLGMGVNIPRHHRLGPFVLADIGALLVSWVMFINSSRAMEISGFCLLAAAAIWDRQLRKRHPSDKLGSSRGD